MALTPFDDVAKGHVRVPVGGGAVPPLVPELVLALVDAPPGPGTHRLDGVRVVLTDRHLLLHQAWQVLADAHSRGGGQVLGLLVPLGQQGRDSHSAEIPGKQDGRHVKI